MIDFLLSTKYFSLTGYQIINLSIYEIKQALKKYPEINKIVFSSDEDGFLGLKAFKDKFNPGKEKELLDYIKLKMGEISPHIRVQKSATNEQIKELLKTT